MGAGEPLVGRVGLLADLVRGADAARGGAGSFVGFVGPPGIGKSALSDALAARVDDAAILTSRCSPPPSTPRRALSEVAVQAIVSGASVDALGDTVFAAAVRSLLEETGGHVDQSPPVVGEGLRRMLGQLTGLVVWRIEDLHWADQETLAVLDSVVDRLVDTRCLIVATARPHASPALETLLYDWQRRGVGHVTQLPPLTLAETAELVSSITDGTVSSDRERMIVEASEGSPLLAEAFARDARDLGPGRHPGRLEMPTSYRVAVERRLAGLAPATRELVCLAALVGRSFDIDFLVRSGVERSDATQAADAAVRAQLAIARPAEPVRFLHDLTCDAIVEGLASPERRRLGALGLEAIDLDDLEERHLESAARLSLAAGDHRTCAELLLEAARRALRVGAANSAIDRLDQASGVPDAAVLFGPELGEQLHVYALAGRAAEALALGASVIQQAAAFGDIGRVQRMTLAMARASGSVARWAEAESRLDEMVDDWSEAPVAVAAYRSVVAVEVGDVALAEMLASSVLDRTETPGPAVCEAQRSARACCPRTRLRQRSRALQIWGGRGERCRPSVVAGTLVARARSVRRDDVRSSRSLRGSVTERSREWVGGSQRDVRLQPREPVRAVAAAQGGPRSGSARGLEVAQRIESPMVTALNHLTRGQAYAELGQFGAARLDGDKARAAAPESPEIDALALGMCDAWPSLLAGSFDDAASAGSRSLDALASLPVVTATSPWYTASIIVAVAGHAEVDLVRRQFRSPQFSAVPSIERLTHLVEAVCAGREGNVGEANRQVEAVVATDQRHPEIRRRLDSLWILLEGVAAVAALECGWGDPIPRLVRARDLTEQIGLGGMFGWFADILRDAGVAPRRRGPADHQLPEALAVYGLTACEFDVLRLLGERLTNREIAKRLVIAPSTVKTHVERLLSKTGRRGRVQLAELLRAALGTRCGRFA